MLDVLAIRFALKWFWGNRWKPGRKLSGVIASESDYKNNLIRITHNSDKIEIDTIRLTLPEESFNSSGT